MVRASTGAVILCGRHAFTAHFALFRPPPLRRVS